MIPVRKMHDVLTLLLFLLVSPSSANADSRSSIQISGNTSSNSTMAVASNETGPFATALKDYLTETEAVSKCGDTERASAAAAPSIRRCKAKAFGHSEFYKRLVARYPVEISSHILGGVEVEVFDPVGSGRTAKRPKVLINLHGGGFFEGWQTFSRIESIPISHLGKVRVVSVNYRHGPEHEFPSAIDDVETVYRALLESYRPSEIGIYGSSAGGLLTAQLVTRLVSQKLPLPGAIGMFGMGAAWIEGDSASLRPDHRGIENTPYFSKVRTGDPLAFPLRSPSLLAHFPPSLLISSTRDLALSSVVGTHAELIRQGVGSDLHVWEGMGHCFFYLPDLPESQAAYDVIVKFFKHHLNHPD